MSKREGCVVLCFVFVLCVSCAMRFRDDDDGDEKGSHCVSFCLFFFVPYKGIYDHLKSAAADFQ